jgi:hypothetical protein
MQLFELAGDLSRGDEHRINLAVCLTVHPDEIKTSMKCLPQRCLRHDGTSGSEEVAR